MIDIVTTTINNRLPHKIVVSPTLDLFATGMVDSQLFLDIVLHIETATGMTFSPDDLDFDGQTTVLTLARAFRAP